MTDTSPCDAFKALSDPNRIRIVEMLADGEKCACRFLDGMELSQPTLSHHMKVLIEAGLVRSRKEGKWVYYRLNRDNLRAVAGHLLSISEENDV